MKTSEIYFYKKNGFQNNYLYFKKYLKSNKI